ncbi:TFIIB-type zinc ribbon-containing protein [Allofranklinella schreckenbergeri]|uniref:TFIIB-type zinc ribbon-containing protein n=1 Tax=Allofranklinella schreckenbergeri TaxID=1076744 RepID=UPI001EEE2400|nr:zf-TFIIB domain-containing protein [Allofranklinella schreckenbergeri]
MTTPLHTPACPSCRQPMQALSLEARNGPVELDLCFACHGIWFDRLESLQLSARSVLALFKTLHAHRDAPHSPLRERMHCPRCAEPLTRGSDRTISGSYIVYRCATHGRFSTFSSFMVEKGFVRHLAPAEIERLAQKVRTIHCSSCGASVDLRRDHACPYCRSAFSLLDPQAVEKALERYQQAPAPVDPHARVDETSAAVVLAKERMHQQNRERERQRRREEPGWTEMFQDELWSAGLSLLLRSLARWLK